MMGWRDPVTFAPKGTPLGHLIRGVILIVLGLIVLWLARHPEALTGK